MRAQVIVAGAALLVSASLGIGGAEPATQPRPNDASPAAEGVEDALAAPSRVGPVRPVEGAVVDPFDPPDVPWGAGNRGVKLAAVPGEPVRAALAGTVAFAGHVAHEGWVTLDHGGGLETTYGVAPVVAAGRRLRAGEVVGTVPDGTDRLHWGMRLHGAYVDPWSVFGRWRPRLVPVEEPASVEG